MTSSDFGEQPVNGFDEFSRILDFVTRAWHVVHENGPPVSFFNKLELLQDAHQCIAVATSVRALIKGGDLVEASNLLTRLAVQVLYLPLEHRLGKETAKNSSEAELHSLSETLEVLSLHNAKFPLPLRKLLKVVLAKDPLRFGETVAESLNPRSAKVNVREEFAEQIVDYAKTHVLIVLHELQSVFGGLIGQHMLPPVSEFLQDYLREVALRVENPRFVKVGANDGISGDPCGDIFLTNPSWTGLLIEPVPGCVKKLSEVYFDSARFEIVPVAVGPVEGQVDFFVITDAARSAFPNLPVWHDQIGSLDRNHILKHFADIEPFIETISVKVERLDAILDRYGYQHVDFLQIDAEGYDLKVMQSINLDTHQPQAIWVEHAHLSNSDRIALEELLGRCNYLVKDQGEDLFARKIP